MRVISRIAALVADGLQQHLGVGECRGLTLVNGTPGTQGVDVAELLPQSVSVEE
jgi:hypothetical protein